MRFFSVDNVVWRFIRKIGYLWILNILWVVTSLPVFTIGASTTALYYTCLKIVRNEEGNVTKTFFKSFKENFRQATVIWLILFVIGSFLAFDFYVLYNLRLNTAMPMAAFWTILLAILIGAIIIYLIVLFMIFPLQASVINTTPNMFKNAFLIGTHYLFAPILVFAVHFAMFYAVVAVFTPLIVFGEGFCAMVSSFILNRLLISVTTPAEAEEEKE